jgi:hypothetical protein
MMILKAIHEGRGEWQLGPTRLANVTLVDEGYEVCYKPWVVELSQSAGREESGKSE